MGIGGNARKDRTGTSNGGHGITLGSGFDGRGKARDALLMHGEIPTQSHRSISFSSPASAQSAHGKVVRKRTAIPDERTTGSDESETGRLCNRRLAKVLGIGSVCSRPDSSASDPIGHTPSCRQFPPRPRTSARNKGRSAFRRSNSAPTTHHNPLSFFPRRKSGIHVSR